MIEDDECGGCGSTLAERQKRRDKYPDDDVPTGLTRCPHCDADKCCMCDMGDDTECASCD